MSLRNILLNESIMDKGIMKAMFLAGGQCSGKTTISRSITSGQISPRIVNVDKFVDMMSNGENIYDTPLYDKIERLSNEQMYLYINSMLPLIIDGVGANPDKIFERKRVLEDIGYDTGMLLVSVPLETALRRLDKRNALGGRQVGKESLIIRLVKNHLLSDMRRLIRPNLNTEQCSTFILR